MNKLTQGLIMAVLLPGPAVFAADTGTCNQLGREIALRAAEELPLALDAEARTQLAAIAESACLAYGETALVPAAAAEEAAGEADSGGELFDLEIIDPEDRVRRAGLKRR